MILVLHRDYRLFPMLWTEARLSDVKTHITSASIVTATPISVPSIYNLKVFPLRLQPPMSGSSLTIP